MPIEAVGMVRELVGNPSDTLHLLALADWHIEHDMGFRGQFIRNLSNYPGPPSERAEIICALLEYEPRDE